MDIYIKDIIWAMIGVGVFCFVLGIVVTTVFKIFKYEKTTQNDYKIDELIRLIEKIESDIGDTKFKLKIENREAIREVENGND